MVGRRTCPRCGATNLESAPWCGQCYEALDHDGRPPRAAQAPGPVPGWTCRVCGEENPVTVDPCATCGASLLDSMGERERRPAVSPATALRLALVPGWGMGRVGMAGEGLIAALLIGFCLLGGLLLLAAGEGFSLALLGAGSILWVATARDAFVVAVSGREAAWLQPRTLTVVAVIVLLLTAAALLRAIPGRGTG